VINIIEEPVCDLGPKRRQPTDIAESHYPSCVDSALYASRIDPSELTATQWEGIELTFGAEDFL
jgi:hypothetical protein